ncbi:hypothetical protein N0V90_002014 [Kalmusia sp. IMI 367209]|nr:hypothetical protein N0V90_002014 [Kalmusia sp. IMI 367209]
MRALLYLFALVTLVAGAAILRDDGKDIDDERPMPITRPDGLRNLNNVVEVYDHKNFQGDFYQYTKHDTDGIRCKNFKSDDNKSIRQRPSVNRVVVCHYFANDDTMDHHDSWEESDLSRLNRHNAGSWENHIGSMRCAWQNPAKRDTVVPVPISTESSQEISPNVRGLDDIISIYTQKDFRGQYFWYSVEDTDKKRCKNFWRLVGDHQASVTQVANDVRCHYFALHDCERDAGVLTKEGTWRQSDLSQEPRPEGNWYDNMASAQCFWIWKTEANADDSSAEFFTNHTALSSAKRDVAGHNEDRLVSKQQVLPHVCLQSKSELYLAAQFQTNPIAWVTQQNTEREKCIDIHYP